MTAFPIKNYLRKVLKYTYEIKGQTFLLLAQKAIFWKEEACLIISDLHLGKSHHFRKGGVGVPKISDYENLAILKGLLEIWKPKHLLLLGDLFHSEANQHVFEVKAFLENYPAVKKHLVIGNHDVMDSSWYQMLGLSTAEDTLAWGPFLFSHEPLLAEELNENTYNICGHIHPGVQLVGKGRKSLTLSCFYFSKNQGILPAFGKFTGNFRIKPQKGDVIFGIANQSIIKI